jgi:hypothetical protein
MILTNPYITLGGVDKFTGQPLVNITAANAPAHSKTGEPVGTSLVFENTNMFRDFANRLIWVADQIDRDNLRRDPCSAPQFRTKEK